MKINLYLTECKKEEKIACGWCMYLKYIHIIIQLLLEAFVILSLENFHVHFVEHFLCYKEV